MTIFDSTPHPDERVEWLRAQVEEYIASHPFQVDKRGYTQYDDTHKAAIVEFVRWMEERFQPRGFFDR